MPVHAYDEKGYRELKKALQHLEAAALHLGQAERVSMSLEGDFDMLGTQYTVMQSAAVCRQFLVELQQGLPSGRFGIVGIDSPSPHN